MKINKRPGSTPDSEQEVGNTQKPSSSQFHRLMKVKAVNPDKFKQSPEFNKLLPRSEKVNSLMVDMLKQAIRNLDTPKLEEEKKDTSEPTTSLAGLASIMVAPILAPPLAGPTHGPEPNQAHGNTDTERLEAIQKTVERLVSRILVSIPNGGEQREVHIKLASGPLKGTEILLKRHQGEIKLSFLPPNAETKVLLGSLKEELAASLKKRLPNEQFTVHIRDEAKSADSSAPGPSRRIERKGMKEDENEY